MVQCRSVIILKIGHYLMKSWSYNICDLLFWSPGNYCSLITARCTLVQSAVLRSHVVRPSVCPSVRLSVRPSVTLVDQDHIGWKSWKLTARTISLRSSEPKRHPPTPRGTWRNLGESRGGVGKMACWRTKAAISLKRVKIDENYYRRPIATHQRSALSNGTIPDPLRPPLRQDWGPHPTQNSNRYYLRKG